MTQPMDRSCSLPQLGEVDEEAGEFWAENILQLPAQRKNLSAYERNRLYLNTKGDSFLDGSFASGVDLDADSRSVVAADFDRDGAVDLLVGSVGGGPLRLFLNNHSSGQSLSIRLVGTTSNRSAIGTRIVAQTGDMKIVRDVFPANGFMGIGPPALLLGTGSAAQIDRLAIRWPTGEEQVFENIPANGEIEITEGETEITVLREVWR